MRTPPLSFFARPADEVAPELLGSLISTDIDGRSVAIRITEVEAYRLDDPASHTYRGKTPRNEVMFGRPGHLYVYFTYGMHFCANVVSHAHGSAGGVLLRSGEVVGGLDIARERRTPGIKDTSLARGPACLAQSLGITRAFNGTDLLDESTPIKLVTGRTPAEVVAGPRVGVSLAADVPWRFWLPGDPTVSAYKRSPRAPVAG